MSQLPPQTPAPGQFNNPTLNNPPPAKSKSPLMLILGIIGGIMLLSLVCCGGLMYYGYTQGAAVVGNEVVSRHGDKLESSPEFQEHVGSIQEAKLNFMATTEAGQQGDPSKLVLDVVGDKGSAQLKTSSPDQSNLEGSELILPDGTVVPLTFPEDGVEDMLEGDGTFEFDADVSADAASSEVN